MLTGVRLAILVLALSVAATSEAAIDCRAATPLPDDLTLVAPTADVPESLARFAGAWSGAWRDPKGNEALCTTLVVEEVLGNGYVRVVYSVGVSPALGVRIPSFWRAGGRITEGVLRFRLPTIDRGALAYRFDGSDLTGTYSDEGAVRLGRIADMAAMRCGRASRAAPGPPVAGLRDHITAGELLAPTLSSGGPVHNDYFMPVGIAGPAKHTLRGTLTVAASSLAAARDGCAAIPWATPTFSVTFFTSGEYLVPVVRDFVPATGTLILSPGRVWSEPGDGGMSRASFPFVLVNQFNNATHNGIATFLFDDTRVSALRLQVVQETALWAKVDVWGQVPITYAPEAIADETALRAEFADELRRQTPIRPWSALPASSALAAFDGDAAPLDISANGLVVDGVLYLRGCHTRYGPFPYCREMRHGVFSVTKSAAGAVALLRLAQKYGDGVLAEKLVDYLPAGLAHAGWDQVTFADALSMATGIGDEGRERDGGVSPDENRPKMSRWVRLKTAREKLEMALGYGTYPWGSGEVLRYNTTQTFVLAVALDTYLKRREGANAHLWDMVRAEVDRPIGIVHAPAMHTIEADGSGGVPLLGYGLYLTIDDVAKITTLLQNGGRHEGVQLLSATKLAEALYRTEVTVGLANRARNRFGEGRYHLSFWSVPYRTSAGCSFQIPYMAGLGGNLVALLPNGVSVFRFADGNNYDLDAMVLAGESIRPFCPAPATVVPPDPARVSLTTKSFVSTVLGLLVEDGKARLDAKVATVLPSLAAAYPDVTFRHLTTMTSGYRAEGDTPIGSYTWGPSPTPFTPSTTPLFTPPGSKYAYWDSAMNQLAHALTRIAGEPLAALFKRRIADPIGMDATRWYWPALDTQDGLVINGGAGNHQADVHISAREFARLGLLYLNRGRWNDRQLLSAAWVDAATRPQVPASLPRGDPTASPANGAGVYGLNWWANGMRRDGQPLRPGVPLSAFGASGWNNNRLFVIPDWGIVVVRLGQDQTRGFAITAATWTEFLRQLGAAVTTRGAAPR
jgi:CubicO group peptidase (beta-lactamase class C family)